MTSKAIGIVPLVFMMRSQSNNLIKVGLANVMQGIEHCPDYLTNKIKQIDKSIHFLFQFSWSCALSKSSCNNDDIYSLPTEPVEICSFVCLSPPSSATLSLYTHSSLAFAPSHSLSLAISRFLWNTSGIWPEICHWKTKNESLMIFIWNLKFIKFKEFHTFFVYFTLIISTFINYNTCCIDICMIKSFKCHKSVNLC